MLDGTDDPSGRTTSYGYDFAGEATSRQYTHGATTDPAVTTAYDANGRPTTATDPSVGTTSFGYDPAGDLIEATTPGGRTTRYGYDSAGRRVKTVLPDGQAYEYSYDNEGHVGSITPHQVMADTFTGTDGARLDPSKWTFVSGATIHGNQARLGLNATTGLAGMLAYPLASADQNTAVTYRFGDNTNPQTFSLAARASGSGSYKVMIDSNSTTAHLAKVTGAGTATTLGSFTVPEDMAAHRVRLEVVGSTIRARVWDPSASEPSTWDVSVADSTYTAAGFVLVTTSQTGTASTSVDVDDFTGTDPSNPPGPVATYTYDPAGRVTSAVLAGGVHRGWHYTDGLLDSYTQTGVGSPVSDTLAYDPVGRLASINSTSKVFAYDHMDQLTSQTIGSTTTTFGYDGNGRRISKDQGSTHLTYTYDAASQLSAISDGTAYTYDPAGRRQTVTRTGFSATYGYDTPGRLGTLTTTQGSTTTTETRSYDPFSTLIGLSDHTGTTTTSSVYDWNHDTQNPHLVGSTVDQATTDLIGAGSTDVTITSGVAAGTSQDNFGSITATPTAANLKACTSGYDAWGNPTATPTPSTIPCLGYRDQISTNTLYYAQARNYDPTIGAFTTTDPAQGTPGNATATALYPYANNNPITNTDPTGNYAITDDMYRKLPNPDGSPHDPNGPTPDGAQIPCWTGTQRGIQFVPPGTCHPAEMFPTEPAPDQPEPAGCAPFHMQEMGYYLRADMPAPCGFIIARYKPIRLSNVRAGKHVAIFSDGGCSRKELTEIGSLLVNGPLGSAIADRAQDAFDIPCKSHDYGYDLLRFAKQSLGYSNIMPGRFYADGIFNEFMKNVCHSTGLVGIFNKGTCTTSRNLMYDGVSAWTLIERNGLS